MSRSKSTSYIYSVFVCLWCSLRVSWWSAWLIYYIRYSAVFWLLESVCVFFNLTVKKHNSFKFPYYGSDAGRNLQSEVTEVIKKTVPVNIPALPIRQCRNTPLQLVQMYWQNIGRTRCRIQRNNPLNYWIIITDAFMITSPEQCGANFYWLYFPF